MKESISRTRIELDATNPITGEVFKVQGLTEQSSKYYSVRKITSRINAMDLFTIMADLCRSPKDIQILNSLTDKLDKENTLRIDNISNLAKELGVSRPKLTMFLKSMEDYSFADKLDRGIYFVNPYVFVGKRVNSNKLREELQEKWVKTLDDSGMAYDSSPYRQY